MPSALHLCVNERELAVMHAEMHVNIALLHVAIATKRPI